MTPFAGRGQSVGLLGGSFDPPHEGHVLATEAALKRLGLDWAWWLVSPGNPLKAEGPAPVARRVAAARALLAGHPRVKVSDVECRLGTRRTAQTIRRLRARCPHLRFVWVMGADNLAQLHRWGEWRFIMETVPVCVIARPGARAPRFAPAARAYRSAQLNEGEARLLARARAPAWVVLNVPLSAASSSAIRARGGWR